MSGKVCDKLSKMPWKKYDVNQVPEMAGIYAIGQKIGSKDTEYLYIGRSKDVKRRLQQHKTPTPQQEIGKTVARKFKQHKQSELRIKYVSEPKQKSKESAYIDCMIAKNKYRPLLNKRSGDGCTSYKNDPKMWSSGRSPALRSGGPKVRSPGGIRSIRSSARPKVRSGGRVSSRSFGGRRGR